MNDVTNQTEVRFSPEAVELIQRLVKRYPSDRSKSALIPALHIVQAESGGWLSAPVMDKLAELLQLQPIEVYEVASFYSMFNLKPVGKCLIEVCRTSSCWLRGANDIVAHIEKRLGIKDGETTADGKFTLKTVECLGSCGTAPMLQIGEQFHENLTLEKVDGILEANKSISSNTTYLDQTTFRKN